jgi:hypothetical protein
MTDEWPGAIPQGAVSSGSAEMTTRGAGAWRETLKNIPYTRVVARAVRVFLYQPFNIPLDPWSRYHGRGLLVRLQGGLSRFSIRRALLFGSKPKLGDVTFSAFVRGVQRENSES